MIYDFLEVLYWSITLLTKAPLVLLVPKKVTSFAKELNLFDSLLFSKEFLASIFSKE